MAKTRKRGKRFGSSGSEFKVNLFLKFSRVSVVFQSCFSRVSVVYQSCFKRLIDGTENGIAIGIGIWADQL